jgi:hypothetical protein
MCLVLFKNFSVSEMFSSDCMVSLNDVFSGDLLLQCGLVHGDQKVSVHSECGSCYTEHGLREHISACQ